MMDKKTQKVIDKCHMLVVKGYSIEYCLQKFRDYEREIRDYFSIAQDLKKLSKIRPSKKFAKNSLDSIISMAKARDVSEASSGIRFSPKRLLLKPAMIFIAFVVISVFSFAGTLFASQESVPGETLYPLKRSFENFQLIVYPEGMKGGLHLKFLGNRIEEAEVLLDSDDAVDPLLIEELISEMDRQYQSCNQYNCLGPDHEDDILDSMNSVKNRYRNRFGEGTGFSNNKSEGGTAQNGNNETNMNGGRTDQGHGKGGQGSGKGNGK